MKAAVFLLLLTGCSSCPFWSGDYAGTPAATYSDRASLVYGPDCCAPDLEDLHRRVHRIEFLDQQATMRARFQEALERSRMSSSPNP